MTAATDTAETALAYCANGCGSQKTVGAIVPTNSRGASLLAPPGGGKRWNK